MSFTPQSTKVQTVSELTSSLKGLLESHYSFVSIVGEISNLSVPYSGHHYFTLKDDKAQIKAVLFKGQARYLASALADGQHVVCKGRLTIYEPRGDYQIIIDHVTPKGEGNLQLALEKLKTNLAAEGLFDQDRKHPLPFLASRICLITSPTGAAIHDFLKVALERYPNLQVEILPVKVQGDGAAQEICKAIEKANKRKWAKVIVLARGGGSLEDLWAFNNESLARTIVASNLPIVSAVGHEVDFTIVDFVADLRAPTPTGAAEMVVPDRDELVGQISAKVRRLCNAQQIQLKTLLQNLDLQRHRLGDPRAILEQYGLRVDYSLQNLSHAMAIALHNSHQQLERQRSQLLHHSPLATLTVQKAKSQQLRQSLVAAMTNQLAVKKLALARSASRLDSLSPLAILGRGYSLTYNAEMELINSISQIKEGQEIRQQLVDGIIRSRVEQITPTPRKAKG